MSMIPLSIEDTNTRLDDLLAALESRLTDRHVARGFVHYSERSESELFDGVLNILTTNEGDYATSLGMIAKEGTTSVSLIGHIRVEEEADTATLEQAELAFIEQLKTQFRLGLNSQELSFISWEKSRLMEFPYGWFVVQATLGPPRANTH